MVETRGPNQDNIPECPDVFSKADAFSTEKLHAFFASGTHGRGQKLLPDSQCMRIDASREHLASFCPAETDALNINEHQ